MVRCNAVIDGGAQQQAAPHKKAADGH